MTSDSPEEARGENQLISFTPDLPSTGKSESPITIVKTFPNDVTEGALNEFGRWKKDAIVLLMHGPFQEVSQPGSTTKAQSVVLCGLQHLMRATSHVFRSLRYFRHHAIFRNPTALSHVRESKVTHLSSQLCGLSCPLPPPRLQAAFLMTLL